MKTKKNPIKIESIVILLYTKNALTTLCISIDNRRTDEIVNGVLFDVQLQSNFCYTKTRNVESV